jgi:hypothetical protein
MGRPWWEGEKKGKSGSRLFGGPERLWGWGILLGDLGTFQPALTADAN